MSIIRNTPFVLIGIIDVCLLFVATWGNYRDPFFAMAWMVIISFGCYLPVAIIHFAGPLNAVLMILKTIAYVSMVFIGFRNLSPML